jgi:prepilin-type processing-associated H-X9-DG protein
MDLSLKGQDRQTDALLGQMREALPAGTKNLAAFRKAGGRWIYVVVSFGDTPGGLAFAVAPLTPGADGKALTEAMNAFAPDAGSHSAVIGNAVVLADAQVLAKLQHMTVAARPELARALGNAGDAPVSVALIPSEIVRRIFEASVPRMPAELGGGPTTVLSQGVRWASVAVKLPPEPSVRIFVQSQDADAAQGLAGLVRLASRAIGQNGSGNDAIKQLASAVSPEVEADHVTITLQGKSLQTAVEAVATARLKGRTQAARVRSASNIKQLLLTCYMYAEHHKNQWPDNLEEVLTAEKLPKALLTNPIDPTQEPGYVYIKPPATGDIKNPSALMVIHENFEKWGGVNVGFADGHTEWVSSEDQFKQLLAEATKAAGAK